MTAEEEQVLAAVAATLRQVAGWGLVFGDGAGDPAEDELRHVARQVELVDGEYDICCPLCEETICDGGCPLEAIRERLAGGAGRGDPVRTDAGPKPPPDTSWIRMVDVRDAAPSGWPLWAPWALAAVAALVGWACGKW